MRGGDFKVQIEKSIANQGKGMCCKVFGSLMKNVRLNCYENELILT